MIEKIDNFFIKLFKKIKNIVLYRKDLKILKNLEKETSEIIKEHASTHKDKHCVYCGNDIEIDNKYYAEYDLDKHTIIYQCKDCYDIENELMNERDAIFKEHCPRHNSSCLFCESCNEYLGENNKTCYMDNVEPHNTKDKYYLERKY